jgi:hypothetical protein
LRERKKRHKKNKRLKRWQKVWKKLLPSFKWY